MSIRPSNPSPPPLNPAVDAAAKGKALNGDGGAVALSGATTVTTKTPYDAGQVSSLYGRPNEAAAAATVLSNDAMEVDALESAAIAKKGLTRPDRSPGERPENDGAAMAKRRVESVGSRQDGAGSRATDGPRASQIVTDRTRSGERLGRADARSGVAAVGGIDRHSDILLGTGNSSRDILEAATESTFRPAQALKQIFDGWKRDLGGEKRVLMDQMRSSVMSRRPVLAEA